MREYLLTEPMIVYMNRDLVLKNQSLKMQMKEYGFTLSIAECLYIFDNVHLMMKEELKRNSIRFCRSYPFNFADMSHCDKY
jgi:hypothetical protein